jgi:hypothetical protein
MLTLTVTIVRCYVGVEDRLVWPSARALPESSELGWREVCVADGEIVIADDLIDSLADFGERQSHLFVQGQRETRTGALFGLEGRNDDDLDKV